MSLLRDTSMSKPLFYYRMVVAYNGERYHGFQRQTPTENVTFNPDRPGKRPKPGTKSNKAPVTVQECLEWALCEWMPEHENTPASLCLRAASRTDKGVHARGQVAVVTMQEQVAVEAMRNALNARLPRDISIESVDTTDADFDPRHQVQSKIYSYTLKYRRTSGPVRHALDPPTMWVVPWALDDTKLDASLEKLTGEHNYSAFVHKKERQERNHTMKIEKFWTETLYSDNNQADVVTMRIFVRAKGFRRSMVRNLVGFCVDVCRGQLIDVDWDELWRGSETAAAWVHAAPACGLCLESVFYE